MSNKTKNMIMKNNLSSKKYNWSDMQNGATTWPFVAEIFSDCGRIKAGILLNLWKLSAFILWMHDDCRNTSIDILDQMASECYVTEHKFCVSLIKIIRSLLKKCQKKVPSKSIIFSDIFHSEPLSAGYGSTEPKLRWPADQILS